MSLTASTIAISAAESDVLDVLPSIWEEYRFLETSEVLPDFESLLGWCSPRSEYLDGDAPFDAKGVCVVGGWCLLLDFSQMFGLDEDHLVELSRRFGTVIVGASQGTSGIAVFALYRDGEVQRRIEAVEGAVQDVGTPLLEEAGLDLSDFYLPEVESLWRAFGLGRFPYPESAQFRGLHLEDLGVEDPEFDYEVPSESSPAVVQRARPWWKFW